MLMEEHKFIYLFDYCCSCGLLEKLDMLTNLVILIVSL